MQADVVQTLLGWAGAVLLYPGLIFAVLFALAGEWLSTFVMPLLTPRLYRPGVAAPRVMQPFYDVLKLAGKRDSRVPLAGEAAGRPSPLRIPHSAFLLLPPLLALALMPVPGNLAAAWLGPGGDLLTILLLLAIYPLGRGLLRMLEGGLGALDGARDLGRLLTGLLPVLLSIAALVQVSAGRSLQLAAITAAPETAAQTFVRLIAAVATLVAFPWWSGRRGEGGQRDGAGTYAAGLLQMVALSVFWALLVLPMPGNLAWAVVLIVLGALFAYVAMAAISARWWPVRREKDAANLVWATAAPLALIALVIALSSGV